VKRVAGSPPYFNRLWHFLPSGKSFCGLYHWYSPPWLFLLLSIFLSLCYVLLHLSKQSTISEIFLSGARRSDRGSPLFLIVFSPGPSRCVEFFLFWGPPLADRVTLFRERLYYHMIDRFPSVFLLWNFSPFFFLPPKPTHSTSIHFHPSRSSCFSLHTLRNSLTWVPPRLHRSLIFVESVTPQAWLPVNLRPTKNPALLLS